ncbi:MAG: hypothetical protein NW201_12650 [Gemmatimonadales bacterium]|nr:hypothetical protein [Gemmatimonadales bacterium]
MSAAPRHLVAVWNPAYADDAMARHLEVLHACDDARPRGGAPGDDDVYVWWGKVRSANRQGPFERLDELLALGAAAEAGAEVHLYLTDYRSLFVGELLEVVPDDERPEDPAHVPAYYAVHGLACDCWFRLGDLRRLVDDDLDGVIAELRALRNVHYHDRPVSLYGGMVDLPLLVTRPDGERFFDAATRARLLDGGRWFAFDRRRGPLGELERALREDLLGEVVWRTLDPAARGFLAAAEAVVRQHRRAVGHDFSGAVVDYARAVEVEALRVVRALLRKAPLQACLVNVDGRSVDLRDRSLTLGALAKAVGEGAVRDALLAAAPASARPFLGGGLPAALGEAARRRNPAAHGTRVTLPEVEAFRAQVLGIGQHGWIPQLALATA